MFARKSAVFAAVTLLSSCAPPIQTPASLPEPEQVTPQQWAATCSEWDEWDKPAPPYLIHGSTYYVGTCGISAILVAGEGGHLLIDTGTKAGGQVVLDNVGKLGFRPNEIASILHSHEHFDHVGGHALVQRASGAHVVASPESAAVLRTGQDNAADPQYGMHDPIEPVAVDVIVGNGETVRSEAATLTAIATPGHTPGALSWTWKSCDNSGQCVDIVYADSLSPISSDTYRFSAHPDYVAAFRAGLQRLREVDCDLLLTPHPSASEMVKRAASGSLVGGMTCTQYADAVEARLDSRIAEEAGG
ncbi:subclass B3 metallo-beta-lactamase [Qipengyuania qiaonensis]|uniref:Subclass B3 metallo-beta-lactamase n=1 Tax=Qipengyuania qiaonensis TaxID=2867240 RepID=A0ABS7J639_9SPHN|nr:subclass B3 metallo-beta-lactamase [Qipengyuania qiaonensis]MBX7481093.1 subclass B3 metallo-beta-lactamase [Qipengyuania qiaonensis]